MNLSGRLILCLALGALAWLLHTSIGSYPRPLPRSEDPKCEIGEALLLWVITALFNVLMLFEIIPWLEQNVSNNPVQEIIRAPLLTIPSVALPLLVVFRWNRWATRDLRLTLKSESRGVSVFAVVVGLLVGGGAFVTGQTNIAVEPLPAGALLLLLYNNSFIEEFFHRGLTQSKLERALGQGRAIVWGSILFGLSHVVFDATLLLKSEGVLAVFLAVIVQALAGCLLGMIYMKTRSLWPGVACHYLGNWLPSILNLYS